jgi:hypothetical protein
MLLKRLREPFNHRDRLFELKYDGWWPTSHSVLPFL